MYILIFLFISLVLFSLTCIRISIILHRVNEDDTIEIRLLLLFGLIKLKFRINYIDIIISKKLKPGLKEKSKIKSKGKTLSKNKEVFKFDELKNIYNKSIEIFRLYRSSINYIMSKTYIESFKWNTEIGLQDAAATALSTGVLWSIKGSIAGILSSKLNINSIKLNVIPNYNKLIFEINLDCIIRIKIANIIIAGIKTTYILIKNSLCKKGGEINESASYRRINENHNG